MKKINKILCFMLFIITIHTNANANINNNLLKEKMSGNENVEKDFTKRFDAYCSSKLAEIYKNNPESSNKYKEDFIKDIQLSNEYKNKMEMEFPEYAKLNNFDKQEILKELLNTSETKKSISSIVKCIGGNFLGFVICSYGTLTLIQTKYWGACFAAMCMADITAFASDPLLIPTALGDLISQSRYCWEVATYSNAITPQLIESIEVNCASAMTTAMGLCFLAARSNQ